MRRRRCVHDEQRTVAPPDERGRLAAEQVGRVGVGRRRQHAAVDVQSQVRVARAQGRDPAVPAGRHVPAERRRLVRVEVLPEQPGRVAGVVQPGRERVAVVERGEPTVRRRHAVHAGRVRQPARQDRRARRAAERVRHDRSGEGHALVGEEPADVRHRPEGVGALVVGDDHDHAGAAGRRSRRRGVDRAGDGDTDERDEPQRPRPTSARGGSSPRSGRQEAAPEPDRAHDDADREHRTFGRRGPCARTPTPTTRRTIAIACRIRAERETGAAPRSRSLSGSGGRSGSSGTTQPLAQIAGSATQATAGNNSTYRNGPADIAPRTVRPSPAVIAVLPTGPKVVVLRSHLDQWGTSGPVGRSGPATASCSGARA